MSTDPERRVPRHAGPNDSAANVLAPALDKLIGESKALRTDVAAAELARSRTVRVNLCVMGLLVAMMVAMLVIGWQNNQLGHRLAETNRRVADCTTAGGKCYEDGSARTSAAIADLVRAQIFVAECARLHPNEAGPGYDRKVEACVAARLAGPGLRPQVPTPTPGPVPSPSPSR